MTTSTTSVHPVLLWLDAETTGLKAHQEALLEVACRVTDTDLNYLDDGYEATIYRPDADALREDADPYVRQMHDNGGLWTAVMDRTTAKDLAVVDAEVLAHVRRFAPEPKSAIIAGNSVRLDMNFLEEHLPATYAHVHYRTIDVSGVQSLATWWKSVPQFDKKLGHRAMDDIEESIAQLRYLRSSLGL